MLGALVNQQRPVSELTTGRRANDARRKSFVRRESNIVYLSKKGHNGP